MLGGSWKRGCMIGKFYYGESSLCYNLLKYIVVKGLKGCQTCEKYIENWKRIYRSNRWCRIRFRTRDTAILHKLWNTWDVRGNFINGTVFLYWYAFSMARQLYKNEIT